MSGLKTTAKAAAIRRTTLGVREYLNGYRALLEDALREEGLTLPQLRMLKAVADQSTEVSSAAIARFCQITPQTLQIMLERAVREGWVTRGTSARNHRIITVSLTPKGDALRERGLAVAADLEQMLWAGVSRESIEGMNQILDRGLANLHAEVTRRQAKS